MNKRVHKILKLETEDDEVVLRFPWNTMGMKRMFATFSLGLLISWGVIPCDSEVQKKWFELMPHNEVVIIVTSKPEKLDTYWDWIHAHIDRPISEHPIESLYEKGKAIWVFPTK